MTMHTPLTSNDVGEVIDPLGNIVAECWTIDTNRAEAEVTAAEIVRRVNLHDQLLSALKDAHPHVTNDGLRYMIGDLIMRVSK